MYPNLNVSSEDYAFLEDALSLATQTLKLDAGRGDICPATTKTAQQLKQLAEEGVRLARGETDVMERDANDLCCAVDDTWDMLQWCFKGEAKYRDLAIELRQIFREHYIMKYTENDAESLPQALRNICDVEPSDLGVDCVRTRKNPSWAEIVSGMDEERPLLVSWQDARRSHAVAGHHAPPPPRTSTPSTDIAKVVAGLFCEDQWQFVWDRGYRGELIEVIAESTACNRRHRDFNRYVDYLLTGDYMALARSLFVDRRHLQTRLDRPQDGILRSLADLENRLVVWRMFREYVPYYGHDDSTGQ